MIVANMGGGNVGIPQCYESRSRSVVWEFKDYDSAIREYENKSVFLEQEIRRTAEDLLGVSDVQFVITNKEQHNYGLPTPANWGYFESKPVAVTIVNFRADEWNGVANFRIVAHYDGKYDITFYVRIGKGW